MKRIIGLLLASVLSSIACDDAASSAPSATSDDIIGGAAASSATLNAVGALKSGTGDNKRVFCSGTLVAPNLVLTAKHCVNGKNSPLLLQETEISFAIGANANDTKREIKVIGAERAANAAGGFLGLGADVGLYVLEKPVTDVEVIPLATDPLSDGDLNTKFSVMGYGVRDKIFSTGIRTAGTVTLRMLKGQPFTLLYPSYEKFLPAWESMEQKVSEPSDKPRLLQIYNYNLLMGHEAYLGGVGGEAAVCSGDSGSPLLRQVGGKLQIFGVSSWGPAKDLRAPCSGGSMYALIDQTARNMIADRTSKICGSETAQGRCEADHVIHCVTASESIPQITKTDCGALPNQTCGLVDGKAQCVDKPAK
jgi:secreted trypsin-like serine protease